ncbi:MAG TPA: head GIN domain-containing protein [Flavobacterium sp.]|jgi:hypothetical protein
MKNLKSFIYFFMVAVVTASAQSCMTDIRGIKGSGNVVTQNRDIAEDFTRVEVSNGLEVTIEQSNAKAVIVEADDNMQAHITTKVEGGTLKISSDYNSFTNVTKKVTVRMPIIKGLEASGGSTLRSGNKLTGDEISISASSGSEINVSVEAEKILCEASSGSHLTASGKALSLETSSSSGSGIDASKLLANDVHAQSSSGSSTDVHAIVSLDAKASSGSSIDYTGNPKQLQRDENSGGGISGK